MLGTGVGSKVQGGDTALEAMAGIPDGIPVEIQNKETTPWSGKGAGGGRSQQCWNVPPVSLGVLGEEATR